MNSLSENGVNPIWLKITNTMRVGATFVPYALLSIFFKSEFERAKSDERELAKLRSEASLYKSNVRLWSSDELFRQHELAEREFNELVSAKWSQLSPSEFCLMRATDKVWLTNFEVLRRQLIAKEKELEAVQQDYAETLALIAASPAHEILVRAELGN